MIDVACICGKRVRVGEEHAGKRIKCPGCGQGVPVPVPFSPPFLPIDTTDRGGDAGHHPERRSRLTTLLLASGCAILCGLLALALFLRDREARRATAQRDTALRRLEEVQKPPAPLAAGSSLEEKARRSLRAYAEAADALKSDKSDAAFAKVALLKAVWNEALDEWAAPHRSLFDEASVLFRDGDEVKVQVLSACSGLREQDLPADPAEILRGAIYLARHTHYPDRGKPGFGNYCYQYRSWRKEGLNHQQVIAKLDELNKF